MNVSKSSKFPIIVACLSLSSALGYVATTPISEASGETDNQLTLIQLIKGLEAADDELWASCLDALAQESSARQSELLSKLSSSDNQVKCSAAFLLGLYRYDQSAKELAQNIKLQDRKFPRFGKETRRGLREWYWGQYPAAQALIRIGKPSLKPVLENLKTSNDPHVRKISLRVFNYIEGPKVARFILWNAIEEEKLETRRNKLRSALKDLVLITR